MWRSRSSRTSENTCWRTLKAGGELNPKYPGGITGLRARLEAEGHEVQQKGKRFFVADFEKRLFKKLG